MPTMRWLDNKRFTKCRVRSGHAWGQETLEGLDGAVWCEQASCLNKCGAVKHFRWNVWDGRNQGSYIDYPEGYLIDYTKGEKHIPKTEQRRIWLRRELKRRHLAVPREIKHQPRHAAKGGS